MNDDDGKRPLPKVVPAGHVKLHIEELVLHGFPAGERRRIGDAVEMELARLLTESGLSRSPEQNMVVPAISGGSFKIAAGQKSESAGPKIAQSVYGAIQQEMTVGKNRRL